MHRKTLGRPIEFKLGAEGSFRCIFATFDQVDHDGDIILSSAIKPTRVAVAGWGHNWNDLPVGDAAVKAVGSEAIGEGRFYLDTVRGREHHTVAKARGAAMQWSFGFNIKAWRPGTVGGRAVRILEDLEIFEISPVMVAAGIGTRTELVKRGPAAEQHRMLLAVKANLLRADIARLERQERQLAEVAAIRASLRRA